MEILPLVHHGVSSMDIEVDVLVEPSSSRNPDLLPEILDLRHSDCFVVYFVGPGMRKYTMRQNGAQIGEGGNVMQFR